jgi:hypothetical protein
MAAAGTNGCSPAACTQQQRPLTAAGVAAAHGGQQAVGRTHAMAQRVPPQPSLSRVRAAAPGLAPLPLPPAGRGADGPSNNIFQRVQQDLLPDGTPNTAWRRLMIRINTSPSLPALTELWSKYQPKAAVSLTCFPEVRLVLCIVHKQVPLCE